MKELSSTIKELDVKVKELDETIKDKLLGIPNTPHASTPKGNTDEDNVVIKRGKHQQNLNSNHKHIGI